MTFSDEARSSTVKFFFPLVTVQPSNAVGVIGGQAVFTCTFTSTNPAVVTFLWQIQTDGATWADLTETAGYYEGVTTQTLTVKSIDNFLATRTTLNFRCRALFANAVPSFTNPASLTIPIHTTWPRFITACGHATSDPITTVAATTPTVTGFSGPFNYSWAYYDGDPGFTCSNAALAAPTFSVGYVGLGARVSRWICTIDNGVDSVASDPLMIVGGGDIPASSASLAATFPDEREFLIAWNGVRPDNYFSGFQSVITTAVRSLLPPSYLLSANVVPPNDRVLGTLSVGTMSGGTALVTIYFALIQNPPGKFAAYLGAFNNSAGGPGLAATAYG